MTGGIDDDLEAMAEAFGRFKESGIRLNAPYYIAMYADALLHQQRPAEAVDRLDEAEALIHDTTRTYFHRSEIHRLRARAIAQLGEADVVGRVRAVVREDQPVDMAARHGRVGVSVGVLEGGELQQC